jgi:hypothetical protein
MGIGIVDFSHWTYETKFSMMKASLEKEKPGREKEFNGIRLFYHNLNNIF